MKHMIDKSFEFLGEKVTRLHKLKRKMAQQMFDRDLQNNKHFGVPFKIFTRETNNFQ